MRYSFHNPGNVNSLISEFDELFLLSAVTLSKDKLELELWNIYKFWIPIIATIGFLSASDILNDSKGKIGWEMTELRFPV